MKLVKAIFIIFLLLFISTNSYAKKYVIIKDSGGTIVHTHSISGDGVYPYTPEQDKTRFGYDSTYSVETSDTVTSKMDKYVKDKEKAEQDKKDAKKAKQNSGKAKLKAFGLTDEELEALIATN